MDSNFCTTAHATIARFPLLLMTALLAGGCASQNNHQAGAIQSPSYDIAPKQLAQDVRQIVSSAPLSLPVEEEQAGAIVTGWQPFRGDLHIVRYWHERTRYHIAVLPDFNDPAHRSRVQVVDETQPRPEESGLNKEAQQWSAAPDLHRPERSAAVLQQIESQLSAFPRTNASAQ